MSLTFDQADRILDSCPHLDCRKLTNNTYLRRLPDDDLAIKLHATDIIILHADNTYTLFSGGWQTVTTKERINRFTPARIWQKKFVWYMWPDDTPFYDGIKVDAHGKPILVEDNQAAAAVAEQDYLEKMINRMIGHMRKLPKLPLPNTGDCFGCSMIGVNDKTSRPMGTDCVFGHLEECYIHGSLIVRAMQARGFSDYALWHHWKGWEQNHDWSRQTIRRAMRAFLRSESMRTLSHRRKMDHAEHQR